MSQKKFCIINQQTYSSTNKPLVVLHYGDLPSNKTFNEKKKIVGINFDCTGVYDKIDYSKYSVGTHYFSNEWFKYFGGTANNKFKSIVTCFILYFSQKKKKKKNKKKLKKTNKT